MGKEKPLILISIYMVIVLLGSGSSVAGTWTTIMTPDGDRPEIYDIDGSNLVGNYLGY